MGTPASAKLGPAATRLVGPLHPTAGLVLVSVLGWPFSLRALLSQLLGGTEDWNTEPPAELQGRRGQETPEGISLNL